MRTGQIARPPRKIRHQLNHRLADGQPAETVLAWLNDLPAVKLRLGERAAVDRPGGVAGWDHFSLWFRLDWLEKCLLQFWAVNRIFWPVLVQNQSDLP